MENQKIKYYAFISYNHKDSKEAKSLHRKLESYRIPKAVRKEANSELPKRIRPNFLDNDEANPGKHLNDVMLSNLKGSKSLVVICSPDSAKSKYVDFEVNTFQNINKDGNIIPYIIAGSPSSNNLKPNCYPPSLDKETTGVLLEEIGKQKALVKVVAGIFDIDFDNLWNRHKRRERNKIIYWTSAITIIIALFTGVVRNAGYIRYVKEATLNYQEASKLIDEGKTNKGIAYLTKSLEHIDYEPSIQKLNSVLLQESFLVLDTITENKQIDFDLHNQWILNDAEVLYSASGAYKLFIKDGKFNIKRSKDSVMIGSVDLHHQGKISPSFRFTRDEKIMLLAEPIYKDEDIAKNNPDLFPSESIEFRLRVFNVETFSVVKDVNINGALNDVEVSPMGNHVVIAYRKEKEFETTVEAIPIEQSYKKWECKISGNLQKLSFNPNGIYISAILSKDINAPEEIEIYDIFSTKKNDYSIKLPYKIKHYCYNNDGRRLAVLTRNNELYVYDIPKCKLGFSPLMLADSLNVVSVEFDVSDEKISIKTRKTTFSYLLQKTPFGLSKIKFTENVIDKLCCNESRNIIATSHYVYGDKGFISFIGNNIQPLKFNNKINVHVFSPKGNYLVVGTGNLLSEPGAGDIYVYKLEEPENSINNDSIQINEIYHSKLDRPVSNIVFNQDGDSFAAYTVSGGKDTDIFFFAIDNRENVTNRRISCSDNVNIVEFLNYNELAIGTIGKKVELWNIRNDKKEEELNTKDFPVDIMADKNQRIIVASSFNHSSGEIRSFNRDGTSRWDSPITTTFGIQKLIIVDNVLIAISKSNIISIFNLETKAQIVNGIEVQGVIKDAIVVNNNLKILSHYFNQEQAFNLKETKHYSVNDGQQSIIQTIDIKTGEDLGIPLIINDDIIGLEIYKNDLLYYTSNFLVSDQLALPGLTVGVKDLMKIANAIAGCRVNKIGVIETIDYSLAELSINSNLKQWFCSSPENRTLLPGDNTLLKSQIDLFCNLGESKVLQALDIYPNYLKAQCEFWFSEAKKIAETNFISDKNVENINQHNLASMNWETYYSNYKASAVYSDPKAQLFANFYTQLMVRRHPDNISALNERANFCKQTKRSDEYKATMDKIENLLPNS